MLNKHILLDTSACIIAYTDISVCLWSDLDGTTKSAVHRVWQVSPPLRALRLCVSLILTLLAGQAKYGLSAIKWAADYFIKCHVSPNELYGQVGDFNLDHTFWGRPEDLSMSRPAYKIDTQHPGECAFFHGTTTWILFDVAVKAGKRRDAVFRRGTKAWSCPGLWW